MKVPNRKKSTKTIILVNPYFQHQKHRNLKDNSRRKVVRQYPPVNLLQIGGVLREGDYEVRILDCFIEPNPFSYIDAVCQNGNVIFVGISVKMAPLILFAQQLTYYIKRNYPQVKVVWGGLLPTLLPEVVCCESYADYVVMGQGEESALALADAISSGKAVKEIPGVGFLKGEVPGRFIFSPQNEKVPDYNADWGLIGDKLNRNQQPYYAGTVTTRGCHFRCSFCYLTGLDKSVSYLKRWHEFQIDKVLKDVDALLSYGMNVFTFQDDCFLMNRDRILSLIKAFKKREVYIEQCVTSIKTITQEILDSIHPLIQQISYSIETVNPDLQVILNKPISPELILETNQMLYDYSINSVHNFIFAIPGETDDDLRANIDLAVKLRTINPYVRFTGMFCIPYPKTSLERWLREEKGVWVPWDLRMLATTDMTDLKINPAYQPWINNNEECEFYNDFMVAFDAIFSRWQHKGDRRVESILSQPRIMKLFEKAVQLAPPPDGTPYLLDNYLKNPEVPYPLAKVNIKKL